MAARTQSRTMTEGETEYSRNWGIVSTARAPLGRVNKLTYGRVSVFPRRIRDLRLTIGGLAYGVLPS